jgi:hypothetical protein
MFTIFLIVAIWNLQLPLWLQVCLTVFGVLKILFGTGERIIKIEKDE